MEEQVDYESVVPERFSPLIRDWFAGRYGKPTPVQAMAWPPILNGEHVLVTASTGSGKTLTAFLSAINALVTGAWPLGQTSVLYVSPLKALNNDIHRNLLTPLDELRALAEQRGESFPEIRVATRSGDTPGRERQRMLRRPPEILITTPESLNIILSSPRARSILTSLRTVILDEIHAVLDSKRGTHLITAVERTTLLAGEFQRIALSATVRPLDLVADFVGGAVPDASGHAPAPRSVTIVRAPDTKQIELTVDFPQTDAELEPGRAEGVWPHLVGELHRIIDRNRSTLIFVTTRRHAERLTLLLNEGLASPVAYSHHGSLSRELRHFVEQALKGGRLRAIVATTSLELGIDVGSLDEIVLVRTPFSVSSTLQRLGRAGHRVGETSRGTLFPLFGRDMVEAAVTAAATLERDIEDASPVVAPLDVLAQVIVGMTAMDRWNVDRLFDTIRSAWPYRDLERRLFDLVVEMLAGRYAETTIRELRPRVSFDRVSGELTARDGATALLYQSGGTIPDRGYYGLRADGAGKVGELDEEFVWERRVGETFVFGSQAWTITAITDQDVHVVPATPGARAIPFWRASSRGRNARYSLRLLAFLEACETAIVAHELDRLLAGLPHLTGRMRERLAGVLTAQRAATGTALPHLHHVVVEDISGASRSRADDQTREVIVHTGRGGRVNEPLAIALTALWERDHGYPLEVFSDNDCVAALLPSDVPVDAVFTAEQSRRLLRSGVIEELLRQRLEGSGKFGALFRENAGRALLLPRRGFSRRMPLWLTRLRSKKLLSATSALHDFPILLETWRNCLHDEFDLPALREFLQGLADHEIAVSLCRTPRPSPFASEMVWQQVNAYMYRDDSLPGAGKSELADELIREAVLSKALRPQVPVAIVKEVLQRLNRLAPGYAPDGPHELLDWVTERLALRSEELGELRTAVVRDHGEPGWSIAGLEDRFLWLFSGGRWLFATHNRIASLYALYPSATALEVSGSLDWWVAPTEHSATTMDRKESPLESMLGPRVGAAVESRDSDSRGSHSQYATPERTVPAPEFALLELLRFAGPVGWAGGHKTLGVNPGVWSDAMAALHEEQLVVAGELVEGTTEEQVCDTETLEYLLRLHRKRSSPSFEPVPATMRPTVRKSAASWTCCETADLPISRRFTMRPGLKASDSQRRCG